MMKLHRKPEAVLFDMDGLLLDTENAYTEATQQIVGRFGKRFDWSLKSKMVGRASMDSAKLLVETLELPLTPQQYIEQRQEILDQLVKNSRPMPGAMELVQWLADAQVPIALASSSNNRLFALKTGHHREWFSLFNTVVLGDDAELHHAKPAPDIFLLAAARLGVSPDQCLVFEDAPSGVRAARAAGMQVVAVPFPGMDPTLVADADLVLKSLSDLHPTDIGF